MGTVLFNRRSKAVQRFLPAVLGLVTLLGVALLARLDRLSDRELWLDEVCTFYWVHHLFEPADAGADPWAEPAHLPYFLLLRLWTRMAGDTAFGLKSFSVLTGVLAVIAVVAAAWRMGGIRAALIAGLLAAVHPLHVYYSLEARTYTLWTLLMAVGLLALFESARTLRAVWWAVYIAVMWVAVLTHYYTLLWIPASIMAFVLAANARPFFRRWLASHAVLVLMLVPVVWLLLLPYVQTGPKSWLREMWVACPPMLAIPKSFWALMPSGGYPEAYLAPLAAAPSFASAAIGLTVVTLLRWLSIIVVVALVVGYAGLFIRRRAIGPASNRSSQPVPDHGQVRTILFPALTTAAFLLFGWTQAAVVGHGYLVGRYDLAAWPAVIVLLALLIDGAAPYLRPARANVVAFALTIVLLLCSTLMLVGLRKQPLSDETARRAERIAAVVGPDDLVISLNLYRWFMEYEWHRIRFRPNVLSFPTWHDQQLCWQDAEADLAQPDRIARDAQDVADRIEAELNRGGGVWLLAHGEPTGPRWEVDRVLFAELQARGIEVVLADEWLGLVRLQRGSSGRLDFEYRVVR